MKAFASSDGIPSDALPDSLRPFSRDGVLRISSEGPHYEVAYVGPLALALTALGVAALTGITGVSDGIAIIGGVFALTLGSFFTFAAVYSWRGRMELTWRDGTWIATKRLWRWSRVRAIRASQIRHVEVFRPSPGEFGPYVRIHLYRTERTIALGHSLCLSDDILEGLRQLLAVRDE